MRGQSKKVQKEIEIKLEKKKDGQNSVQEDRIAINIMHIDGTNLHQTGININIYIYIFSATIIIIHAEQDLPVKRYFQ